MPPQRSATSALHKPGDAKAKGRGQAKGKVKAPPKKKPKKRKTPTESDDEDGDDGGDDGGDGRIFPGHPSPILHAPRDIISRKGKSLTPAI